LRELTGCAKEIYRDVNRYSITDAIEVVPESFTSAYAPDMGDSRWWRWLISGYRGNKLISARAIDADQAEYVAELYRRDGVRALRVKSDEAK
jgi:hypothetical protein